MLLVEFAERIHRGSLLLAQALSHLRPEGRPVVGAYVGFKSRCQQRAHSCKHGFAAVDGHAVRRSVPFRLRLCGSGWLFLGLSLSLRGSGRLRTRNWRKQAGRAQSHHHDFSVQRVHPWCRSSRLTQWQSLAPLAAVLSLEGHTWERSMSCRKAAAYCQSTVACCIRQGSKHPRGRANGEQHLPLCLASANSEDARNLARDGLLLCLDFR